MPTPEYTQYIRSSDWAIKTDNLKRLRGWRCYICSLDYKKKGKRLDTHHLDYKNLFHETASELVLLCESHHPVGRASMDTLRLMKLLYLLKKLLLWFLLLPLRPFGK